MSAFTHEGREPDVLGDFASPGATDRTGQITQAANVAFFVLLVSYCIWIFSFSIFPTQDGAVHLYYVHVIERLLSHSPVYAQYFAIRHPLPPYLVHYVLLLGLMKVMSAAAAEKTVIVLCVVLFAMGFRAFMRVLQPKSAAVLSLFAIPLSMNWAVAMGFHNYCLSLGLSLFALALWFRNGEGATLRKRAGFAALLLLMVFTHPVPVLITLGLAWADLIVRVAARRGFPNHLKRDLLLLMVCCGALIYIALFLRGPGGTGAQPIEWRRLDMVVDFFKGRPLMIVFGNLGARALRIIYFALLVIALMAGMRGVWIAFRARVARPGALLTLAAAALLVAYPFIPRNINGSDFFTDRLAIYIWVFAIAGAAAGTAFLVPRWMALAAVSAVLIALMVPLVDNNELRYFSSKMNDLEEAGRRESGGEGLFLDTLTRPGPSYLTFEPYTWAAARYFRQRDAIMMNSPWLDLPILPIRALGNHLGANFPARLVSYPHFFTDRLRKLPELRRAIPPSQFLLIAGPIAKDKEGADEIRLDGWREHWDCQPREWFSVCRSSP